MAFLDVDDLVKALGSSGVGESDLALAKPKIAIAAPGYALAIRKGEWTEATKDRLRELWTKGLSSNQIGAILGFTKNAIVGKKTRLGLEGRPSPISGDLTDIEEKRQATRRANKNTLPPLASIQAQAPSCVDARAATRPPTQKPREALARPVPLPKPLIVRAGNQNSMYAIRRVAPMPKPEPKVAPYIPGSSKCCWPSWGNNETPTHVYCDAAVSIRSYCTRHARLGYLGVHRAAA